LAKPRLRLPGLYSWAKALAEDHNMKAEFSDAGHRVEILRRMWGSRAALVQDWAGHLRPIFLAFLTDKKSPATPSHPAMVWSSDTSLKIKLHGARRPFCRSRA
jgi:hypothetical protein